MPMIDAYAATGTFPDMRQLAQDLAAATPTTQASPTGSARPRGPGSGLGARVGQLQAHHRARLREVLEVIAAAPAAPPPP